MTGIKQWENWRSIHNALEDIEYEVYGRSDDEVQYIDDVVAAFQNISSWSRSEYVSTDVYKTHGKPYAEFNIPVRPGVQRCEIADLCIDVEVRVNGSPKERRALLSQSKMSKEKEEKWTIQMDQHYLLTYFPPFSSSHLAPRGRTNHYALPRQTNQFSNYSLASKHDQPTYCSVISLGTHFSNWDYTQGTTTYRHRMDYSHLTSTVGLTSNLVNGYTGVDLLSSSAHEDFIDDLIDYAKSNNSNIQTDGGEFQDEISEGPFTVIRIQIEREE